MKKLLIVLAVFFCVSEVSAQKEKKIFYFLKDSILYVDDNPFTGSVFTFCRLQGNCPPNAKEKEIIVLPNLGIKDKNIDPKNQTYNIFLQEDKTRYWVQVLSVQQKDLDGALQSVVLDKQRKLIVVNTKQFPYSITLHE